MANLYNREYFKHQKSGSYISAEHIIPIILEYIQPKSVIDLGCGVGNWLSVFKNNGVEKILGLDGDYIDRTQLRIPDGSFMPIDLSAQIPKLGSFDLAISLEVAEHLPPKSARGFVEALTGFAPVILFSAAIPFQGGTGHINEQFPEYWVKLFNEFGYRVVDPIRRRIWNIESIEWWYSQNILFFVDQNKLDNYPNLKLALDFTFPSQLSILHPKMLNIYMVWNSMPILIYRTLKLRWYKIFQR